MESKNMNYLFNVEYFEGLQLLSKDKQDIDNRNKEICSFKFNEETPCAEWKEIPGYQDFSAFTLYPGLLTGIGNPHNISAEGAAKLGLLFDYVTGIPYIPGSSLKGMLRAYFPKTASDKEYEQLIRELLPKECGNVDILDLKKNMFENSDIFLGAFPKTKGMLLDMDNITPHKQFDDPDTITFVKIRPGVEFVFSAVFYDYKKDDVLVTGEQKRDLCKQLILLFGIGAKTNTGYGKFSEGKPVENRLLSPAERTGSVNKPQHNNAPQQKKAPAVTKICKTAGCNNYVEINPNTKAPGNYCAACLKRIRSGKK